MTRLFYLFCIDDVVFLNLTTLKVNYKLIITHSFHLLTQTPINFENH